jgi:hypothetical protein
MNAKTIGACALVAILGLSAIAGFAAAAPSSGANSSDMASVSLGTMQDNEQSNGYGPHGTCAMDQTRSMNQTCDGQGSGGSFGPNGAQSGQKGNGPGYPDCPDYPCSNCTSQ